MTIRTAVRTEAWGGKPAGVPGDGNEQNNPDPNNIPNFDPYLNPVPNPVPNPGEGGFGEQNDAFGNDEANVPANDEANVYFTWAKDGNGISLGGE